MDEMVLQAQKWVNLTYKNNAGFQKAPENGKTGWQTMFALTMGLQIELGITTLAPSFGPTTLAKLTERFPKIGSGTTTPKNVVKLVQSAMYCKGYDGGDINGNFSILTEAGVKKLQGHIGSSQNNGIITPKLFKALLNMDAYVSVMNGSEKIRSIQQWLNKTYINRKEFFYMPCDGHFSRDVQKYLMYAIQYEIGMDDNTANGNFGPGTQTGIKQNQLAQGDSDTSHKFVHLFQAALTFNGWEVSFDGIFSAQVASKVKEFQEFSLLSINGKGDFQTWASLLVSTGDTERNGQACDCVTEITKSRAQTLLSAGYQVIGRYLTNVEGSSLNKKIQPDELDTIFNSGLRVFPIYQTYGGEADYFSEAQGHEDALAAINAAKGYGFNKGTVIYFAVDYDATDEEIQTNIIPHFRGIYNEMQKNNGIYSIGIYGSRNVCIQVSNKNYAALSFVSGMSTGFSGNLGFPLPSNWAFDQISTITIGNGSGIIEIDNNIKSGRDHGQLSVNKVGTMEEFLKELKTINLLALQYTEAIDLYSANELVCQYYRRYRYASTVWIPFTGPIDYEWIDFADHALNGRIKEFKKLIDPVTLDEIDVEHLMATINSLLFFTGSIPDLNVKDFCGWAGDLLTVMIDVETNKANYSSVYACAKDYIANPLKNGYFERSDLLSDLDAINIGKILKSIKDKPISAALEEYYQDDVYNRFKKAINNRFQETVQKVAEEYLISGNIDVVVARKAFKIAFKVPDYTEEDGKEVCKAFNDILMNYA